MAVDFDVLKPQILERLEPLQIEKIILFGSYAKGNSTEESDIDLYLVKDGLDQNHMKSFNREARKRLIDLTFKYQIGFGILSSSSSFLESREDYFYKIDILKNGLVINE